MRIRRSQLILGVLVLTTLVLALALSWQVRRVRGKLLREGEIEDLSAFLGQAVVDAKGKDFPSTLPREKPFQTRGVGKSLAQLIGDGERSGDYVYSPVTPSRERISHSIPTAHRFIVWSRDVDRDGKRLLLMDDFSVRWMHDDSIDFNRQLVVNSTERSR